MRSGRSGASISRICFGQTEGGNADRAGRVVSKAGLGWCPHIRALRFALVWMTRLSEKHPAVLLAIGVTKKLRLKCFSLTASTPGDVGTIDERGWQLWIVDRKRRTSSLRCRLRQECTAEPHRDGAESQVHISEASVVGGGRKYLSVLIEIDIGTVSEWAGPRSGVAYKLPPLTTNPAIYRLLERSSEEGQPAWSCRTGQGIQEFLIVNSILRLKARRSRRPPKSRRAAAEAFRAPDRPDVQRRRRAAYQPSIWFNELTREILNETLPIALRHRRSRR